MDFDNYILKGPIQYLSNNYYRLYHKKKTLQNITFITPLYYISNIFENNIILFIDNLHSTNEGIKFQKNLKKIENKILKKKGIHNNINHRSFISEWHGNNYLIAKINNKLNCYNINNTLINIKNITKGNLVRVLVWLKGIVITKKYWCIELEVIQIKLYDELPPTICLITTDTIQKSDIKPPEPITLVEYNKYFRMLQVGVNINAVKIKCKLDGLDPLILDNKQQARLHSSNKQLLDSSKRPSNNNLLQSISSGKHTLNKVTKQEKKPPLKKDSNGFQPTLDDIINIRNKLKPISGR